MRELEYPFNAEEIVRKKKIIPYLLPDGKCQVTIDTNTLKVDTVVVSAQHMDVNIKTLRNDIKKLVIEKALSKKYLSNKTKYLINPTGRFRIGGPVGDTGLTGRKIIVDTYGGITPHGGGAFSGKDYTKVDRSGAYYARYVAKNIVASKIVNRILISASYAIGVSKPVSIYVDIYENNPDKIELIYKIINQFFDFSPENIIKELELKQPFYHKTPVYSHFGKKYLSYEKLDKKEEIIKFIQSNNH